MPKPVNGRKEGSTVADLRSLSRTCGGTGWLDCECGGDFCVCTLNGGMDCHGCEDCREQEDYDESDDDFNPDACPVCGEDIAGHPICPECGYIQDAE
jgi:hypothetical protein